MTEIVRTVCDCGEMLRPGANHCHNCGAVRDLVPYGGAQMKKIALVTGNGVFDVEVPPGATAGDLLSSANLPTSYMLHGPNGVVIEPSASIYPLVQDGQKLFANAESHVGGET